VTTIVSLYPNVSSPHADTSTPVGSTVRRHPQSRLYGSPVCLVMAVRFLDFHAAVVGPRIFRAPENRVSFRPFIRISTVSLSPPVLIEAGLKWLWSPGIGNSNVPFFRIKGFRWQHYFTVELTCNDLIPIMTEAYFWVCECSRLDHFRFLWTFTLRKRTTCVMRDNITVPTCTTRTQLIHFHHLRVQVLPKPWQVFSYQLPQPFPNDPHTRPTHIPCTSGME
jgi:hypothetical protein